MASSSCSVRVALDFSFDHLMVNKDLHKCVGQMSRCYTINRKTQNPLQLFVTSFKGESSQIVKKHTGYLNWDVNFHEESHLDLFKKEEMVYLTSESENVINELDPAKVYIIGALVDHNAHKGLCYKIAQEQGLSHGRLPLSEHIDMKTRKVLTVDHVFAILANVACLKMTWKDAFLRVIPQRKNAVVKQNENMKTEVPAVNGFSDSVS